MADDQTAGGEAEETGRRGPGQSWENLIEQKIREAQDRGDFANLRGRGRPLGAAQDTTDPNWMASSMLQNAGFKPPVLDLAQEIDEGLATANAALERIRRRRAFLVERGGAVQADRDRFNRARAKAIEEYRAELKTINDRVLALSITAPSALHRRSVPIDRAVAEFESACPAL